MDNERDIWAEIAAPLHPEQIKTRTHDGIKFISREDVINRLNAVCPNEWTFEVEVVTVDPWVVKGRLTIRGVMREEFGMPPNDQHFDPPKAAVSDALKRCASQFGFAIELYGENFEETEPVKHWTETQDWKKFWAFTKSDLDLTEDQVHTALGVESVKDFRGNKSEAMRLLKDYAAQHADNGSDVPVPDETVEVSELDEFFDGDKPKNGKAAPRFNGEDIWAGPVRDSTIKEIDALGSKEFLKFANVKNKADFFMEYKPSAGLAKIAEFKMARKAA